MESQWVIIIYVGQHYLQSQVLKGETIKSLKPKIISFHLRCQISLAPQSLNRHIVYFTL